MSRITRELEGILLRQNVITKRDLEEVLAQSENSNEDLATMLIDLGKATEETIALAIANDLQLPFIRLVPEIVNFEKIQKHQLDELWKQRAIAIFQEDKVILTTSRPLSQKSRSEWQKLFATHEVDFAISTPGGIVSILQSAVGSSSVEERVEDPGAVIFVFRHITEAFQAGADEIYIVPDNSELKVYYRIRGKMVEQQSVPRSHALAIISRLRILAGLEVARDGLYTGNIHTTLGDRQIDISLMIAPQRQGEIIALTFIRASEENFLADIDDGTQAMIRELLAIPHGLVLLASPDPAQIRQLSYALLNRCQASGQKVVSVEKKTHEEIRGVLHIDIEKFANGVDIALSQRPDVLYLEEIVPHPLLPHIFAHGLVLLAAPCNNAVDAIRWAQQGIPEVLLMRIIRSALVFSRVRLLCRQCRRAVPMSKSIGRIESSLAQMQAMTTSLGCKECQNSGYQGSKLCAIHAWAGEDLKLAYKGEVTLPRSEVSPIEQLIDLIQFGEISVQEIWPFI